MAGNKWYDNLMDLCLNSKENGFRRPGKMHLYLLELYIVEKESAVNRERMFAKKPRKCKYKPLYNQLFAVNFSHLK